MTDRSLTIPWVVVVMGVSGAGKTVVGSALANALGWHFYEGDDFHSPANKEKMRHSQALTDDDRRPWLETLRGIVFQTIRRREHAVLACSALKEWYRDMLRPHHAIAPPESVWFVHLDVPEPLLRARLEHRHGHFMPPDLLASQLATLEAPKDALWVDGTKPIDRIVAETRAAVASGRWRMTSSGA